MLCKNPQCGIYRLTYDVEYDSEKDPDQMPCTFCGSLLTKTGADILEGGLGGLVREKRPAQIDYVETIDRQFELERSVTFIEGGTGVGKSYAYLVPVLLELLKDRFSRAIIVTANKALQTQLIRDFPRILTALGANEKDVLSYALLKGRNNYACPLLADHVPKEFRGAFDEFLKKHLNKPADKDDWPSDVDSWWWGKISSDNCPNPKVCKIDCNNRGARTARVVVTNYSYFGLFTRIPALLQIRNDKRRFKFLVMDEAHQAAASLRNALQTTIAPRYLQNIAGELKNPNLDDLLEYSPVPLPEELYPSLKNIAENLQARLIAANAIDKPAFNEVAIPPSDKPHAYNFSAITIPQIKEYLTDLGVTPEIRKYITSAKTTLADVELSERSYDHNPEGCTIRARLLSKLQRLDTFFTDAYSDSFSESSIAAIDPRGLSVLPVDIGAIIRPTIDDLFRHVVVTSATLAHSQNDFTHIRSSLGYDRLNDVVVEKVVGSPFDLDRAVRLYVPRLNTIPAKGSFYEWYDEISEEIITLAKASNGNGFVLFTSVKDLVEVTSRTRARLQDAGIPVLTQSEGISAEALKNKYLKTPNSMLYGLKSFWEGVDIQGSKLSLVIIPKLPFPVPDDPILKTLTVRAGANAFMGVTVPMMLETLRQGVGRLIRSQTDMGIVAILDCRFWSGTSNISRHKIILNALNHSTVKTPKGYGSKIQRSLGLKCIDSLDYACTLLKKVIELYKQQKSA